MNELNERIKKVRKVLDLTQQEFADELNVKRNTVATFERGKSVPSDAAVILICKTFNVSETWLRTGEGEMFTKLSEEDDLSAMVGRLITGESADFKRRLVNALSTLKDEQWLLLETKLKEIVGMRGTAFQAVDAKIETTAPEQPKQDLAQKIAELERQNQELAAKVTAMEEEDKARGLWDGSSVSQSASAGSFDPARSAKK